MDYSSKEQEILSYLEKCSSLLEIMGVDINEIKKVTNETKHQTDRIENKVDNLNETLKTFISSFDAFKKETRDVEEKLLLIAAKLTEVENNIDSNDYELYTEICRRNYYGWEEYEELTKKFLPVSEILYSRLQDPAIAANNVDFSPVVIELCRAIENEFLLKIFKKYVREFTKVYSDIKSFDEFYSPDKSSKIKVLVNDKEKTIGFITKTLASVISSTIRYPDYEPRFTLGDMHFILNSLVCEERINNSVLLQNLKEFIEKYFDCKLLNSDYIANISKLVNNYRNPAAHPEYVSQEVAEECKEFMPEQMDYLIDCLK